MLDSKSHLTEHSPKSAEKRLDIKTTRENLHVSSELHVALPLSMQVTHHFWNPFSLIIACYRETLVKRSLLPINHSNSNLPQTLRHDDFN